MSAASAGTVTPTEVRMTAANETTASKIGRRSAMIDHLEELMLRIDPDRCGVAGLIAETMQNVVDPLWSRIDDDIDRPRRIAADGGAVADRVSELPHRPIERPVPRHRHHPLELARNNRRLRCDGGDRLHRSDSRHLARCLVHALLERDLG